MNRHPAPTVATGFLCLLIAASFLPPWAALAAALRCKTADARPADSLPPTVERMLAQITWLKSRHEYGGACIRIGGRRVIYIDPAELEDTRALAPADLILVTHNHPDHFSPSTVERLRTATTWIVTVADCAERLGTPTRVKVLAGGQRASLAGVTIEAVPAYSTASPAHAREHGWVGFVLTVDGVRLYHSGDTSFIPEMKTLRNVDIALLTVRPPYQMSGAEMVAASQAFRPRVVIPVHWLEAERPEVEYLERHSPSGTRVVILQPR